jgi:hypothetical protein
MTTRPVYPLPGDGWGNPSRLHNVMAANPRVSSWPTGVELQDKMIVCLARGSARDNLLVCRGATLADPITARVPGLMSEAQFRIHVESAGRFGICDKRGAAVNDTERRPRVTSGSLVSFEFVGA